MEQYAINVANWLQKQVEKAERNDPVLRPMKDKINEITEQIRVANESDLPNLLEMQTKAINTLLDHVDKS